MGNDCQISTKLLPFTSLTCSSSAPNGFCAFSQQSWTVRPSNEYGTSCCVMGSRQSFMLQEGQTDACPDTIVRAAYDPDFVGILSRADLSRRRQQAANQISKDDTRSEMRQQHLLRGGVRP